MPLLDSRARTPSAELVFFFSSASRLFLSRHWHPAPPPRGAPEICSHAPPSPSHPPSPAAAATSASLLHSGALPYGLLRRASGRRGHGGEAGAEEAAGARLHADAPRLAPRGPSPGAPAAARASAPQGRRAPLPLLVCRRRVRGARILSKRLRKEGIEGYSDRVSGVALLHPYFWGKEQLGGESTDAGYRGQFERTWEFLCSGKFGPNHPYINPASSPEELRQLGSRRVLVTTAELCWFVERARAYAEGIKKCGWEGELEFYETKGEGHVYFLPKPECDNAVKELAVVADFVRRC